MPAQANAPVIIKRKKVVGGDGHHGGAWKVAYADFVTAMMAFFMLMWLLNATTEQQRKGIADYFNPTIPVNRVSGGGSGSFGGDTPFSENRLTKTGTGGSNLHHLKDNRSRGATGLAAEGGDAGAGEDRREGDVLTEVQDLLAGRAGESAISDDVLRHVVTRLTDEGLIVEIFDLPGEPLFEGASAIPTPLLRDLVRTIDGVFAVVENPVALAADVAAVPVVRREDPVWSGSTGRVLAVRDLMADPRRVLRVTGHGDRRPAVEDRMAVRNNRVEMTLLRDPV